MKSYVQRHIILIVLIAVTSVLSAVAATLIVLSDAAFYEKYSYIRFVESEDSIQLTDEDFYDNCAKVVFPVNKYGLPKNDKTLEELEQVVLPHINADSLELVAIVIRGAASPEGPYLNNKRLSQNRAKALTDFITKRLTFNGLNDSVDNKKALTPENITLDYDVEDYRSLCIAMKKIDDPDYEYVKGLCDKYLPNNDHDRLKRALMNARKGQLWKRLLRTYYPQLRSARIMLFFRKYQEPEPILPEPEPIKPDTLMADTVVTDLLEGDTIWEELPERPEEPRRKMLAVKTNLLLDFAYMPGYDRWCPIPNLALEYYPQSGHLTYGASLDMPWWQDYDAHKYFQGRNWQAEVRYYTKGAKAPTGAYGENEAYNKKAYTGFYLQGYVHGTVFGICFDENRGWVGEGAGAGIGAGYVMPITRSGHWKLELGVQLGYFYCKYDPYQYENPVNPAFRDNLYYYKWSQKPEYFKKRQYRWNWLGPTRVGITLSYDLLYRKKNVHSSGLSLSNKERRSHE